MHLHRLVKAAVAISVFAALGWSTPASAQETGRITGRVVAANSQQPLVGAQVFIPGTSLGTLTNSNGTFILLNVPAGQHTVRVQMVGYGQEEETVTVRAGAAASVVFELSTQAIALDEVVVTGAGQATERKRLGNTIATVNAAELEDAPVSNTSEVLQGREPGVIVQQTGGMAGEGSQIRIRGSASLSQSNEPIIYVDGVRVDNDAGFLSGEAGASSRLDDLNPEAIERIEVLKGAAAATLYGTEASNGVIQIFTKDGSAGEPRWTLSVEQGFSKQDMSRYEKHAGFIASPEDSLGRFGDIGADGVEQMWGIRPEPYEVFEVDLFSRLFETGRSQSYALSVSGGSDLMNYFVSGRMGSVDGTMGATEYGPARDVDEQKQANANLTIFPFENFRLRVNTQYVERHHEFPTNGNNIYGGFSLSVMGKPEIASETNPTGLFAFTTLPEAMQIRWGEDVQRFSGGMTASYSPMPSLAMKATFGLDIVNLQGIAFRPFGWNVSGVSNDYPQGDRTVQDRNHRKLTFDASLSWDKDIGSDFSSSLVMGAQALVGRHHRIEAFGGQFPAPGLEVAGAGTEQSVDEFILSTAQAGIFAQEQIGFRDYLFATLGVRYDQHSAFGEQAGGAVYPKVSMSFVPSDMDGWRNELFSTVRFRAALGQSGLQPGAFDKYTTYSPLPSETGPGVEPDNLGNPELKPEVSTEWEAGAEVGLFNNRAALEVTYWDRRVTDVMVDRQFAPTGGFLSTQLDNLGELKAHGIEIGINGTVVDRRNLTVNVFANGSYLSETVEDMGGAPPIKIGYYRYRNWIKKGFAPGAFFGPKLAATDYPFDVNGDGQADSREELLAFLSDPRFPDELALMLADEDGDGDYLDHYLGKPTPDWQGAFGADVDFLGDFSLSTLFEYKAGNYYVHDMTNAFRTSHYVLGRNTPELARIEATLLNPESTAEDRLAAAQEWARKGASLSPYSALNAIKPADYIRWRELSLTYRVPGELVEGIGARSLSLTAGARNLMLWTKYTGIDPESNIVSRSNFLSGVDGWRPGTPRRFTFSARVGF